MKKLLTFLLLLATFAAFAQDSMEKIIEGRAREMYRVINLNEPAAWKKFIETNYTKALIDKPMRQQVEGGAAGGPAEGTTTHEGNIEGKAKMYEVLHNDFAGGKISSLKTTGSTVKMVVTSDGMAGTFTLNFSKEAPYLIEGLGIEVGN